MTPTLALDLRPSLVRPTGVGTYVRALAERIPRLAPDLRFVLFSASFRDRYPRREWPANATLVDRRLPVRLLNAAWHRLGWPPLDLIAGRRIDLTHSPHPLRLPARRARSVVTVHDLFFLKHPGLTRGEVRRDYARLARAHARAADAVICPSAHTGADVQRQLGVPPERVFVIPNGVEPIYRQPVSPAFVVSVLARRGLPAGAILYVGSDEPRKNLDVLRAAHALLAGRVSPVPPLLLVGPGPAAAAGGTGVVSTGWLEPGETRALMASARLLALVSLEEGFGLPVAEAMSAGLPVVCSAGSALDEVAGEDAVRVEARDPAAVATGLERLLAEPGLAEALRERGRARSARFDWDDSARRTLEVYRRLLAP